MKNHLKIYALRIPADISDDYITILYSRVTPQRQAKAKRFIKKADVLRSLLAELLLYRVALPRAGIQPDCYFLNYNKYGKPSLANPLDVHFNLSHAGNIVVCAVDNFPIGIDIEEIQPLDMSVAQNCYTQDEIYRLTAKKEVDRLRYFYDLWTIKESYVKAIGKGLALPINSFSVDKEENGKISLFPLIEKWFFRQYEIDADYILSICASHDNFPTEIIWSDIEDCIKK